MNMPNRFLASLKPRNVLAALACVIGFLAALPAVAAPAWLIATPDETAQAGAAMEFEVVKPAAQAEWPAVLKLRIAHNGKSLEVEFTTVGPVTAEDARRTYRAVLPARLSGLVRVDMAGVESNRLALLVTAADPIEQMRAPMDTAAMPAVPLTVDEPALSAHEPMYIVVGGSGGATARFQLSFKYRIFDPDSSPVQWFSPLSRLHFGYTQSSVWDLGAESMPFRDTSYRPSLFWQGATLGEGLMPDFLRAGYEHESNGKDGANSRSINTLFVQPAWRTSFSDGRSLIIAPKVYGYLDKEDNPNIQRYRGYVDWNFRYGHEGGWLLATQLRSDITGRGSAQFDISRPLRKPIFARTGGFLHFQLFTGYGESLLDYNLKRSTQARVGFSIVR